MKKFLFEYKALRSKSDSSKGERVTVTTRRVSPEPTTPDEQGSQSATQVGTIRTEEYKRDLAEFQARRSSGNKELQVTPVKKKCSRHSLPVSCTDCTADHDGTFNYEKKSAGKYKKKSHKRVRSATSEEQCEGLPNIQFLFQNQVFMPGNMITSTYSEPQKSKRHSRNRSHRSPDMDFLVQRHIDFKDEDRVDSPVFHKNNSLPFNLKSFLGDSLSEVEEVDGVPKQREERHCSQYTSNGVDKNESGEDKLWEVMSELKNFDLWADEQLETPSPNTTKSEDSKCDASAYGLPIVSVSNLDLLTDKTELWTHGKWGLVPVQIKRLAGVTIEHVRKKRNMEINILRKCRHPNIILLMGLYPDVHNNVHLVCERCVDSLYGILHVQGRILTAQMSVRYALDIANALVFLRMQGYVHTALSSAGVAVTHHDAAKLADLTACARLPSQGARAKKGYHLYSPEPQYINIEESQESNNPDYEPLISHRSSEAYIAQNAVAKKYAAYKDSENFRWQAPELFQPDDDGYVHACSKTDVYSLSLILWESCNAAVPWRTLTYEKLKELYVLWKTGIRLPQDGTYPGSLLSLLQSGLKVNRHERIDLFTMQDTLQNVKRNIDDLEYIVVPARLSKKKSDFGTTVWDTTSPTDSDCVSPPQNSQHRVVVHKERDSTTDSSDKDSSKSDVDLLYESIDKQKPAIKYALPEKCVVSDDDVRHLEIKYEQHPAKELSSSCSTPIAKIRARIKDIGTPGTLHRSDSTEYCSILSPNRTVNFGTNDVMNKLQNNVERPAAKLSRSFTPKSYKPLHIKVPECNLESIKSILKDSNESERSSYNFDIKNYSLPTTPIARSNKLRKNAWLSGDLSLTRQSTEALQDLKTSNREACPNVESSPETPVLSKNTSTEKENHPDNVSEHLENCERSPDSAATHDSFTALRRVDPPHSYSSPEMDDHTRERSNSWSFKSSVDRVSRGRVEDDILACVNVKPLVAIHERWIYEANRKTGRSMSLPENTKCAIPAVKPASHCVDTLQKSLPQLGSRKGKCYRAPSPSLARNGGHWEQFCQARDTVAKSVNFGPRDSERFHTRKKDTERGTVLEEPPAKPAAKVDQATDTLSIEEFIRELIRKEFQHMLHEMDTGSRPEDLLDRGVAGVLDSLRSGDDDVRKEPLRSFSRVKINGNNKPLVQITFSRSGENSLHVLDGCVNVTICDRAAPAPARGASPAPDDASLPADDGQGHSLKRCQAFSAIQEARSTEDLYIDDDLSTQMQENFGGRVKLIPLHGSLHEILCEREDDCCLVKVKQENGCDTIYFRCDNSDTESRDAVDAAGARDTVVYKRSISLVEERIQRIFPKDKRTNIPVVARKRSPKDDSIKTRPKSEIFVQNINRESRALSNSSPSLSTNDNEVQVNIENVMCYQDSSSDECLKCQVEYDDFEFLERKIEEDLANSTLSSLTCGCLEKISEENLSVINEEADRPDGFEIAN